MAGHIHDRIQEVGGDQAFAQRLTNPQPVRGIPVTLPFARDVPADWGFWKCIAEREPTTPLSGEVASHFRRAFVPLRCSGRFTAPAEYPRLEAHLHRFGILAVATTDLIWPEPVTLKEATQRVQWLEEQPATVLIAGREANTLVASAAADAASTLMGFFTGGQGQSWDVPQHRLVTVIEGSGPQPDAKKMPAQGSAVHVSLHHLAGGGDAIAQPSAAFVAQFTNAGYGFPPARLVYMLNTGTSALLRTAWDPKHEQRPTASDWHRERTLLTAYVSALAGLVRASSRSANVMFPAWADTAAKMLARLYGPGGGYLEWGRFPAELLHRTATTADVQKVLGAALTYNPDYPADPYPQPVAPRPQ